MLKEDPTITCIPTQVWNAHKHTSTHAQSAPTGNQTPEGYGRRCPDVSAPASRTGGQRDAGAAGGEARRLEASHGQRSHGTFLCSTGTEWMSLLHYFQRRSLLVLSPNINQNLPDNSPCFYHLYETMNELHSINRFAKRGCAFCKH